MAFKRKRSSDESADWSPVSVSSFTSSRASQSPTPISRFAFHPEMQPVNPIRSEPISSWSSGFGRMPGFDMNSRTRKRFRDNRPNETLVHENTMHKLFAAQRQSLTELPSAPPPQQQPVPMQQKTTLHSFWSLPTASAPVQLSSSHTAAFDDPCSSRCEDCDNVLRDDDAMDMDQGGDARTTSFACQTCYRNVCHTCAVVGNWRSCLNCATHR